MGMEVEKPLKPWELTDPVAAQFKSELMAAHLPADQNSSLNLYIQGCMLLGHNAGDDQVREKVLTIEGQLAPETAQKVYGLVQNPSLHASDGSALATYADRVKALQEIMALQDTESAKTAARIAAGKKAEASLVSSFLGTTRSEKIRAAQDLASLALDKASDELRNAEEELFALNVKLMRVKAAGELKTSGALLTEIRTKEAALKAKTAQFHKKQKANCDPAVLAVTKAVLDSSTPHFKPVEKYPTRTVMHYPEAAAPAQVTEGEAPPAPAIPQKIAVEVEVKDKGKVVAFDDAGNRKFEGTVPTLLSMKADRHALEAEVAERADLKELAARMAEAEKRNLAAVAEEKDAELQKLAEAQEARAKSLAELTDKHAKALEEAKTVEAKLEDKNVTGKARQKAKKEQSALKGRTATLEKTMGQLAAATKKDNEKAAKAREDKAELEKAIKGGSTAWIADWLI
jgi:hypothetical protein